MLVSCLSTPLIMPYDEEALTTKQETLRKQVVTAHPFLFLSTFVAPWLLFLVKTQSYLKKKILHFFYKGEGIGNVFFILAKVVIFPNFVPESPMKKELNCIFCVYLYWFRLACIVFHFFVWIHFFPLLLEIGPSGILWGTMYVNFISPSLKKKKIPPLFTVL